jgi:hypothetical protein
MRSLTANEMLTLWETGGGQSLVTRSLNMIRASCSIADVADPAALSIGERDTRLFRLREGLFGPDLYNIADCPHCHERVEWNNKVADFQIDASEQKHRLPAYMLATDGYTIQFRLPNSYDIARASVEPGYKEDPRRLFFDCIVDIKKDNEPCSVEELSDHVLDLLDARMAEEDPCADIRLVLNCPRCAHEWELAFDIVSCLWLEIDTWGKRILREVAVLASAFGWSESDILSMSAQRRKFYLQMIP